jgi:DNA modification methylase
VSVSLLRADARALPLPDASVDLIVTSPPYWALRSYTDAGEHYDGQIGAEPTPAALIDCTREWMRVLKPTGSIFVNLGDKYAQGGGGWSGGHSGGRLNGKLGQGLLQGGYRRKETDIPTKSLIGLPWRYALRCIDDLGLILRAEVIWSKPNGLPESVTDRVRRSHETWFHLVRSPRYFAAVDTIREAYAPGTVERYRTGYSASSASAGAHRPSVNVDYSGNFDTNSLGKLPGSVWTVATQPLKVPAELGVDHFAAFPMDWPRRIILGWSPSGICTACGEGRRPVSDVTRVPHYAGGSNGRTPGKNHGRPGDLTDERVPRMNPVYAITGEACACPDTSAPTRPSVVVDPFGGTGTTALVAHAYGRHGVSVDMSADYLRLARWRTTDPGQLAAALEVEKPALPVAGQLGLFEVSA